MKSFSPYILPISFLLLLGVASLQSLFSPFTFTSKYENRELTKAPKFDINHLDNFPPKFDTYYQDHFPFRTPMLDQYHQMDAVRPDLFANNQKSLKGKAGWCFLAGKEKDIFQGKRDFTAEQDDYMLAEWQERKKYFDELSIPFYWVIAPAKHVIYDEFLPDWVIPTHKERRVNSLINKLEPSMGPFIIEPCSELRALKEQHKLYYRLDNHWTHQAGFKVGEMFVTALREKYPTMRHPDSLEVNWVNYISKNGFHVVSLGLEDQQENILNPHIPLSQVRQIENFGFNVPKGFMYPDRYAYHYKNDRDTSGLKLLLIRDSFGDAVVPYLNEFFAETLVIFDAWRYKTNQAIVEKYQPDVVLFLGYETHIENLIEDYPLK